MDSPLYLSRSDSYLEGEDTKPGESSNEDRQGPTGFSTQLPMELLLIIVEHLAHDGDYPWDERYSLSKLSTVCYAWSQQLRPRLFSRLSLRSVADMRFLLKMLRDKDGQWLSAALVELEIIIYEDGAHSWFDRFCKLVSNRLTALQRLTCRSNLACLSLSSRPFFASHRHITRFSISGFQFPSFSAFARLLGELRSLEDLKCSEIYWAYEEAEGRPLARMPPFYALRRIVCTGMTSPWIMALLFAPRIARCYVSHGSEPIDGSPEAWMLVLLSKMALNKHPQTDGLTIFLHNNEIMLLPPHQPQQQGSIGQVNIVLWPAVEAKTDELSASISAIRRILLCSNGVLSNSWSYLDLKLTTRVNNFESLTILYDHRDSGQIAERNQFIRRFPRLRRLGSFHFRMRLDSATEPFLGEFTNVPYDVPDSSDRGVSSKAITFANHTGVPAFQDPDYPSYDVDSHNQVLFVKPLETITYYIHIDGYFVHEASPTEVSDVVGDFPFTRKAILEHVSIMLYLYFSPGGSVAVEDIHVLRVDRYGDFLQPILALRPDFSGLSSA